MNAPKLIRRLFLTTTALAAASLSFVAATTISAAEPAYVLQTAKSKSIKGTYAFEVHLPNFTVQEWILFVCQSPSLPSQSDVRTTFSPRGELARDYTFRNRTVLRSRVPATTKALQHTVAARIETEATLYSRHLVKRERGKKYPAVTEPSEAEWEKSTAETELINYSDETFQTWLKENRLHRRKKESDLDFARRAFLAITQSYEYDYADKMDRHASYLCEADKTDCGGMCVLFAAILRANDVPARLLCGRWAKSSKPDAELNGVMYRQQHVKAEFFAEEIGWVPVDPSSAVLHDKSEEGVQYFGHDRGDFFTVHLDPDFEVDTIHYGRRSFAFMQGFHYWVKGSGKTEGETMKLDWQVEVVP